MKGEPVFEECYGGVTAPRGFSAGGISCGIRKTKQDLALVRSDPPATVAGVFTLNKTQAAPILVDKLQLSRSTLCSAVIINSGNANACTGERGLNDAWTVVQTTARTLGVPEEQVLVSSTGVIGQYLPMEKLLRGIPRLAASISPQHHTDAAAAIMTTDTFPKEYAVRFSLEGATVTVGGMAKGSGMIAPNMATMLGFLTTDAAVDPAALAHALRQANDASFNRITVDGDMSTNDMVLLLANGTAGNPILTAGSEAYARFCSALEHVAVTLAKMIARDGEGATKLVEVYVAGAADDEQAVRAARAVAGSNLVKTAIHGADANWGRIMAAVGYSGIDVRPEEVEISFNDLPVLKRNFQIVLDEARAREVLQQDTITIAIDLHRGNASARFWTCDLTKEYIRINASYRS